MTRLLRAADLRAMQRTIASVLPPGLAARQSAVIVPTRSAAEQLRRTIENRLLQGPDAACVLPDLITRDELYVRLHERLPQAPPLLTEFERDVLLRLAAEDAQKEGIEPPFRLRPGLLSAILLFYDELRRRGRTIDSLDRHVRIPLEAGHDTDRGARHLLAQTMFLSATFAAFERRVADSERIDEHLLRALLLSEGGLPPFRQVLVAVADQAADPHGLWPVDFDLLARLPGLERVDVVATERILETGWHERVHDVFPGIEEARIEEESDPPVLLAPGPVPPEQPLWFLCRDREEELVEAARWTKRRASGSDHADCLPLDRTAVVFQRPLPYLYLAHQVFTPASIPYQAMDALPLASEPFSAALDLVFTVAIEDASRTAIVELLTSPHWRFRDPAEPDRPLAREDVSTLDRVLQESKYLGGWDRLNHLAATVKEKGAAASADSRWRRAQPALGAAVAVGPALESLRHAPTVSGQIAGLLRFVETFEVLPVAGSADYERHMRARAAVLSALEALAAAHRQFDDRAVPLVDLVATIRRWIEGQTFVPRTGREGILLLDAPAARFCDVDAVRIVGLVESDWPGPTTGSIFYPASLLRALGWPPESERRAASRACFQDLIRLAGGETSVSSFMLEEDALVPSSPFLEDLSSGGLIVRRQPSRPAARIFAHEALSMEPVAPEAVAGSAADWLDLRLARTSALDLRYRGMVGAQPPAVYAVSRVERYVECPFKYFAGQVLQLEEEREDESGLTPQERGVLLHGVFEGFFKAWRDRGRRAITTANLDDAVALFEQVAETHLLQLPEGDRALERTYLLGSAASPGLAARAFAFEIEQGVEVIERLLEHSFSGTFTFDGGDAPRQVRVRGKADRIDLLADGTLRIVDYKLGRAPKPARALQLPIYSVCAAQELKDRHGRPWAIGRAGYLAFKEKNPFVDLGGRAGNLDAALKEGQLRFVSAAEGIEAGEFPPSPDEPWTCNRCGFPHVCRKDYVGDE
jgi:hypothetical protein